ncbi:DSBA-like thioredoxin domain-containing protein [Sporodiniella umbellata]|nr:DSBA-like thioredoxin domain-containing protein [Sporodiniella umbellata]
MVPMITNTAAAEDINLKFGGVISNTFDSHRLIWWSSQHGKQAELVEEICKLYFERNEDLADHEHLAVAAEKAGLAKAQALEFIKSDQGVSEVRELLKQNVFRDVSGVPHYIINDKYSISGAQEPDTLVRAFTQITSKE